MLKTSSTLCTECRICQLICSFQHFGENNPKRARIFIEDEWPKPPGMFVCRACPDRDCIAACPEEALSWDGWVRLAHDKCDSCGACLAACPVGGVRLDPRTGLPLICDTCSGAFLCTTWCPTRAVERTGR